MPGSSCGYDASCMMHLHGLVTIVHMHMHRACASVHPCMPSLSPSISRLGDADDVCTGVRAGVGHEEGSEEVRREQGGRGDGSEAIVLVEALEG